MKRTLALLLALVMAAALFAGCGSGNNAAPAAGSADAAETTKFVMGIDPEYPPFSYLGDDGDYTGFDVEICQAVCDYLGWELEIFGVNWDEKLVQLDSFECDCVWSGMTILDSMKEAGYVISEPYYDNTQVLVVKSDSGFASSADLADLAGTFENVLTCDSFLKCFTELEGGSVDAVFVDMPVAASYVANHEGLTIIDEELGAEQYGIAFRADDAELCAQVEAAVQALVANGTYAEIAAKYPDIVNNLLFLAD